MHLHKLVLAAAVFLCGCGTAITVTNTKKVGGIPFYVKVAACKHETVWLEPTYKVTLVKTYKAPVLDGLDKKAEQKVGDKAVEARDVSESVGVRLISLSTYNSKEFRELSSRLENSREGMPEQPILGMFAKLKQCDLPTDQLPKKKDRILASNENAPVVMVDYANPYYYNVKRPILGSVTATADLNADGTLSSAPAIIEDKTLQAILDLFPVKDVLSAAAKGSLGVMGFEGSPEGLVRLKLTIEPQVYKYTLSTSPIIADSKKPLPCPAPTDILAPDDLKGYNVSRTTVTSAVSSDKTDSQQNVKFAGTVELPKPEGAKTPASK